jgi:hypothetical protein
VNACVLHLLYHLSCWCFFTTVAWLLKLCLSCHSHWNIAFKSADAIVICFVAVAIMLLQHSSADWQASRKGKVVQCTSRPFFPRWWGSRMPPVDPARINYHPDRSPHGDTPPHPPPARLTWVRFYHINAAFFRTIKRPARLTWVLFHHKYAAFFRTIKRY